MFGTNRIARAVYASLTEEERQLEKLALTIPGFDTREQMEKERLYRIKVARADVSVKEKTGGLYARTSMW